MIPQKPIANPSIVLREEFDDWALLYDPDTGEVFGLNPTGVFIWKCLDGKHTIQDIIKETKENCDNVPDDVNSHVTDFITELIKRGLAGSYQR
jgi:SynChlorMet cassette protein ScmD